MHFYHFKSNGFCMRQKLEIVYFPLTVTERV